VAEVALSIVQQMSLERGHQIRRRRSRMKKQTRVEMTTTDAS
jgi:hypothetical protein